MYPYQRGPLQSGVASTPAPQNPPSMPTGMPRSNYDDLLSAAKKRAETNYAAGQQRQAAYQNRDNPQYQMEQQLSRIAALNRRGNNVYFGGGWW